MHATKRQLLIASAVGASGIGAVGLFTREAKADITFGGFVIDDYSTTKGEADDAILTVDSEVKYAATHGVDEIHVELEIGRTENTTDVIAAQVVETNTDTYEDTITLEGSILSTGAFSRARFDSVDEFDVHARLILRCFKDDEQVAAAAEQTVFTISVVAGEFELSADVQAAGELRFE